MLSEFLLNGLLPNGSGFPASFTPGLAWYSVRSASGMSAFAMVKTSTSMQSGQDVNGSRVPTEKCEILFLPLPRSSLQPGGHVQSHGSQLEHDLAGIKFI